METLTAFLLLPALYLSAVGWGGLLERRIYGEPVDHSAYSAALGMLVWLLLGAALNMLAMARPLAYDALLISGLALAALQWRARGHGRRRFAVTRESIPVILVLLVGAFHAWGVLPAGLFNHHDDLYKYLPRALRVLETGTLAGNPFDLVGVDGLGTQTFFQGFFLAHLPYQYINGFDAVFCAVLAALLLDSLCRLLDMRWPVRALAVTGFLLLNPQYVNISALYSGMLMILGLVFSTLLYFRAAHAGPGSDHRPMVLPIGLFAAATASLKVIFIPFATAYLVILTLLLLRLPAGGGRLKTLGWLLSGAAALYAAWALPARHKLVELASMALQRSGRGLSALTSGQAGEADAPLSGVFNQGELLYGGHIDDYLALAMVIVLATLAALYGHSRRSGDEWPMLATALLVGTACVLSVFGILIGVHGIHPDALVRYNAPVLIVGFATLVPLLYAAGRKPGFGRIPGIAALLVLSMPLLLQGPLWLHKAGILIQYRHMLSYTLEDLPRERIQALLSEEARLKIGSIQDKVPPGETLLSWVHMPQHLDYARNRILSIDSPTRLRALRDLPEEKRAEWLERRLRDEGVAYVIWHHAGRPPPWGGKHLEALSGALTRLNLHNRSLHLDPAISLFELGR